MNTKSASAVRPKEIGENFQSLIAGWEYNTSIGKGVTSTSVVSFPSKSNLVNMAPLPKPCLPTYITINDEVDSSSSSQHSPERSYLTDEKTRSNTIFNTLYRSTSNQHFPITPTSSRNTALREQFLLGCNDSSSSLANTPSPITSSAVQFNSSGDQLEN